MSYLFCFFFSSRRRHTRFDCDWSSDVCSSDLGHDARSEDRRMSRSLLSPSLLALGLATALPVFAQSHAGHDMGAMNVPARSEERRVGKECRSRWSPYH